MAKIVDHISYVDWDDAGDYVVQHNDVTIESDAFVGIDAGTHFDFCVVDYEQGTVLFGNDEDTGPDIKFDIEYEFVPVPSVA